MLLFIYYLSENLNTNLATCNLILISSEILDNFEFTNLVILKTFSSPNSFKYSRITDKQIIKDSGSFDSSAGIVPIKYKKGISSRSDHWAISFQISCLFGVWGWHRMQF